MVGLLCSSPCLLSIHPGVQGVKGLLPRRLTSVEMMHSWNLGVVDVSNDDLRVNVYCFTKSHPLVGRRLIKY